MSGFGSTGGGFGNSNLGGGFGQQPASGNTGFGGGGFGGANTTMGGGFASATQNGGFTAAGGVTASLGNGTQGPGGPGGTGGVGFGAVTNALASNTGGFGSGATASGGFGAATNAQAPNTGGFGSGATASGGFGAVTNAQSASAAVLGTTTANFGGLGTVPAKNVTDVSSPKGLTATLNHTSNGGSSASTTGPFGASGVRGVGGAATTPSFTLSNKPVASAQGPGVSTNVNNINPLSNTSQGTNAASNAFSASQNFSVGTSGFSSLPGSTAKIGGNSTIGSSQVNTINGAPMSAGEILPNSTFSATSSDPKKETNAASNTSTGITAPAAASSGFASFQQSAPGASTAPKTTSSTGGFGNFGMGGASAVGTSATAPVGATIATTTGATTSGLTTNLTNPVESTRNSAAEDLKGKMLSSILAQFDKGFSRDFHNFHDISRRMLLRDLQVIDRGNEILTYMAQLDSATASAEATRQTLADLKAKQSSIASMMQRLEDVVQPVYEKVQPTFTKIDDSREATYGAVINLFDEVEALRLRLQQSVAQHNQSLSQLRERDDMEKVTGLVDYQLSVLGVCAQKAIELERELDYLLGKPQAM